MSDQQCVKYTDEEGGFHEAFLPKTAIVELINGLEVGKLAEFTDQFDRAIATHALVFEDGREWDSSRGFLGNSEIPRQPLPSREDFYRTSPPSKEKLEDMIFRKLQCTEQITLDFIIEVLHDIKLFDNKQRDYGPRNIAAFGEQGCLVRANDKIQRLINLKDKAFPTNESIVDSWRDLSVYGVIARLCRGGRWPE